MLAALFVDVDALARLALSTALENVGSPGDGLATAHTWAQLLRAVASLGPSDAGEQVRAFCRRRELYLTLVSNLCPTAVWCRADAVRTCHPCR